MGLVMFSRSVMKMMRVLRRRMDNQEMPIVPNSVAETGERHISTSREGKVAEEITMMPI